MDTKSTQQHLEDAEAQAWQDLYRSSSPAVQAAMARRRVETRGMSDEERLSNLLEMEPEE
jgi:hypothetical protein